MSCARRGTEYPAPAPQQGLMPHPQEGSWDFDSRSIAAYAPGPTVSFAPAPIPEASAPRLSSRANSLCERPTFARISAIGGSVTTRPTRPRFSWRMPVSISRPTFRRGLVIFELPSDSPKDRCWYGRGLILGVDRQHPDQRQLDRPEVDDPHAAPLPAGSGAPAELPDAARAGDDRPRARIAHEHRLQRAIFLVAEVAPDKPSEQGRFNEREHSNTIRL